MGNNHVMLYLVCLFVFCSLLLFSAGEGWGGVVPIKVLLI